MDAAAGSRRTFVGAATENQPHQSISLRVRYVYSVANVLRQSL